MVVSGHGKSSRSSTRLSGTGAAADAGGAAAGEGVQSVGSGPASRRAPAVRKSVGVRVTRERARGAEEGGPCGTQAAPERRGSPQDQAGTQTRPGNSGLRDRIVDHPPCDPSDSARMWDCLSSLAGLAHPAAVGMELSASDGPRLGARRREDPAVETAALAGVKKKAKNEGRTIVFIDESGLSERPHRCRTWAPRGQTPVLQYHFNWKTLSALAGGTWWNFYFRLFPGTIRSPQVIEFLEHLLRHIPGKLLVVWDGLTGHRSRMTWEFIRQQRGRLWVEFLPGYAPELNPVEYLWSHWKQHELPNFCPQNFGQLSSYARKALRRMRKRSTLVIAFWRQAELFPL